MNLSLPAFFGTQLPLSPVQVPCRQLNGGHRNWRWPAGHERSESILQPGQPLFDGGQVDFQIVNAFDDLVPRLLERLPDATSPTRGANADCPSARLSTAAAMSSSTFSADRVDFTTSGTRPATNSRRDNRWFTLSGSPYMPHSLSTSHGPAVSAHGTQRLCTRHSMSVVARSPEPKRK